MLYLCDAWLNVNRRPRGGQRKVEGPVDLDARLAAVIADDAPACPDRSLDGDGAVVYDAARRHRVLALLGERIKDDPRWPQELRERLRDYCRQAAAVEIIRVAETRRVLDALAQAGVASLVFKGGALAHSHYRESWHRSRDDTDVLVPMTAAAAAAAALETAGYERIAGVTGELASSQMLLVHTDARGVRHNVDLHWRLSNAHRYAQAMAYSALWDRAVELPALGDAARAPAPGDALLIACVHRVAHHHDEPRLLWLYDIHLLVSAMTREAVASFASLCAERDLMAEARLGLLQARERFETDLPTDLVVDWSDRLSSEITPPGSSGSRRYRVWLSDLRALPDWRQRIQLLREHAFPPAEYMLTRFRTRRRWLLPLLYLVRAMRGSVGLFRRPG